MADEVTAGRSGGTARLAACVVPVLLISTVAGCAAHSPLTTSRPDHLEWPNDDPRIRLEGLIELGGTSPQERRSWLREWLDLESGGAFRFLRPYAVAWAEDDLLVADPDGRRVSRIGPRGKVRFSPPGLLLQPIGVAVCRQGVVVTDSREGRVALLDEGLRLVRWLARGLSRPTGVCCTGDTVYVAETGAHRILVLSSAEERRTIGARGGGPGEFNYPTSLALDGNVLLVGDSMNFRVQRIDPATGRQLGSFGTLGDAPGSMPRLKGIAVDRAGHLWIADGHLDQVSIFDLQGTLLLNIGGTGEAPGQFSFPAGIAAHVDGRVVVADSLNRRLVVFRVLDRALGEAS